MKVIKRDIFDGVQEVYGLMVTPDYSNFIIKGGAPKIMSNNWKKLGLRLNGSVRKVIKEHDQKKVA